MRISQKVVGGVAVLAVGVLALGACSSNTGEQPQESNSLSATQGHEAAKAEKWPTDQVTMPAASGPFSQIGFTHNPQAKCDRKETQTELVIACTNVPSNYVGDAVYVRTPNDNFNIRVENKTPNVATITTLRDALLFQKDWSQADLKDWVIPEGATGWGVGADSEEDHTPANITFTITKFRQ